MNSRLLNNRLLIVISGTILLIAPLALAQPRGGPGRGGRGLPPGARGGPQGGTERLVDDMPLTSLQQGLDLRAALIAYDQTVREQTLQARTALMEKMKTILSEDQLSRLKDQLDQIPAVTPPPPQPRGIATSDLVNRVVSFDKNQNGLITKDELPERMANLLSEGDANHDGALNKDELNSLAAKSSVNNNPPGRGGRGGRNGRGRPGGPPPGGFGGDPFGPGDPNAAP
jgi:hypothetical protein